MVEGSPWWVRHRRASVAGAVVVVLGVAAFLDWPHKATAGDLRIDYATYATQIAGDVQSCSTEVEQAISAYNQITAGVSTQRETAAGIASQAALDCTPMGSSSIDDLGTLQPPRSLARFRLDVAAQHLYAWCFSDGVDAVQDIQKLMSSPGDPTLLAHLRAALSAMQAEAAVAQAAFDRAASSLGAAPVPFALDEVRPGVLVG
jgi:hypothetical protein